jgi:hypothetical protein
MEESLNVFYAMKDTSFREEGSWYIQSEGCHKNDVLSVM